MHYILCTMYYVLYTMHYILCTMYYVLYTMHYVLWILCYVTKHKVIARTDHSAQQCSPFPRTKTVQFTLCTRLAAARTAIMAISRDLNQWFPNFHLICFSSIK